MKEDMVKMRCLMKMVSMSVLAVAVCAAFILMFNQDNSLATAKEIIVYQYPEKAKLGKGYSFKFKNSFKNEKSYGIAKIKKNGAVKARLKLTSRYGDIHVSYARKIGKKYYFDAWVGDGGGIIGTYTYKPGAKKFKKVAKKVIIDRYRFSGRYSAAYYSYLPSDSSGYLMCIFDTKKNKKISLGKNVKSMYYAGKKLYYVKFNDDGEKATVYKCNRKGKNRSVVLREELYSPACAESYERAMFYYAEMDKHYVRLYGGNYDEYGIYEKGSYSTLKIKYR